MPFYQKIIGALIGILAGIVLWGEFLESFHNILEFYEPWITYLGTLAVILIWGVAKKARSRWVATSGQEVTILGLGPKPFFGMVGLLASLWIPYLWFLNRANAVNTFEAGIMHLEYYDLLKAERHFCQATKIDPEFLPARLYLARTWRDRGYDGAATIEAQRIVDMANSMKADPSEVRLYEAFRAETRGKWDEAIDKYRALWDEKGIHAFDVLTLVHALNLAGQNRLVLETIDEIRARYAEKRVELLPRVEVQLEIERAIALMNSRSIGQLAAAQEAERVAQAAEGKAHEVDNTYILARAQFVQCDALRRLGGEYEPMCNRALAGFQRQGENADVGKIYQIFGHDAADPKEGLSYYRQALDVFKNAGFERGIADVLTNISMLLYDADRKHEAGQVCGTALATATRIASLNLPEIRLDCTYYAKLLDHKFAEAKKEAKEVLPLTRQQGNRRLEATALQAIAYAAHASRLHEEALSSYIEAMTITSDLQDQSWEARETILLYAWLLSDLGRHSEAHRELERALEPYTMSERRQKVEEVVCWDRPILGPGTAQWLQMLEGSAGFTPMLCDHHEDQVDPLGELDSAVWTRVEVKEPNC